MSPFDLSKLTGHAYSSTSARDIRKTYTSRIRDIDADDSIILPFPPREGGGIPADYTSAQDRKRRKLIIRSGSESDSSDSPTYPPTPSHEQGGRATSPVRKIPDVSIEPQTPPRRSRPKHMPANPRKHKRFLPTDPLFLTTLTESRDVKLSAPIVEPSRSSGSPGPPLSSDELGAEDIESSPPSVSPLERHTIFRDKVRKGRYVEGHQERFILPPRDRPEDRVKQAWKDVLNPGDGFRGIRNGSEQPFRWRRGLKGNIKGRGAAGSRGVFRALSLVSTDVASISMREGLGGKESLGEERTRDDTAGETRYGVGGNGGLGNDLHEPRGATHIAGGQVVVDVPVPRAGTKYTPEIHEEMLLDALDGQEIQGSLQLLWDSPNTWRPASSDQDGDPDCEIIAQLK